MMMKMLKKNWLVILILVLGLAVRLVGLRTGYWYNQDTARDILVAREAVATGQIPLVGSFSSAGPFVFGPHWYWFLMVSETVGNTPFILIILSLLTVLLIALTAYEIGGKKFFLITLIFTSLSPLLIESSWAVINQGLSGFFCALILFLVIHSFKFPDRKTAFLLGFAYSFAIFLHYQTVNLLFFIPLIAFNLKFKFTYFIMGFLIPSAPFLYWDYLRNFNNVREIIYYFMEGQNKFYVPNRWLTHVFEFIPGLLGGKADATLLIVSGMVFWRRWINKKILVVGAFLLFEFILLRFYKGPKFTGYFVYLFPFIALIMSYAVTLIWEKSKLVFLMFAAVFFVNFVTFFAAVIRQPAAGAGFDLLPREKITVYSENPYATECAYSLALYLDQSGMAGGRPVEVCPDSQKICSGVYGEVNLIKSFEFKGGSCSLYLTKVKKEDKEYSRGAIYDDVQNWWKK